MGSAKVLIADPRYKEPSTSAVCFHRRPANYRMEYDSQTKAFQYSLDEAKRARAEKLDGSYLLKTDARI